MTVQMIIGLRAKHQQLAAQILKTQDYLNRLVRDLEAIEAALRVVDPMAEEERARLSPLPQIYRAGHGEVARTLLGYLREMPEATSRDLAIKFMSERDIPTGDRRLLQMMMKRVNKSIAYYRKRGVI